jgi:hypothetical protein
VTGFLEDLIKELSHRMKSSIISSLMISWSLVNVELIFYFFSEKSIDEKLDYISIFRSDLIGINIFGSYIPISEHYFYYYVLPVILCISYQIIYPIVDIIFSCVSNLYENLKSWLLQKIAKQKSLSEVDRMKLYDHFESDAREKEQKINRLQVLITDQENKIKKINEENVNFKSEFGNPESLSFINFSKDYVKEYCKESIALTISNEAEIHFNSIIEWVTNDSGIKYYEDILDVSKTEFKKKISKIFVYNELCCLSLFLKSNKLDNGIINSNAFLIYMNQHFSLENAKGNIQYKPEYFSGVNDNYAMEIIRYLTFFNLGYQINRTDFKYDGDSTCLSVFCEPFDKYHKKDE